MNFPEIKKSGKLDDVLYEIRGPVMEEANRLEEEGFRILKLNIGNPAAFGFNAPDELLHDIIINLHNAQGYCPSKGLFSARKAVMQYYQSFGMQDVITEEIYIGNGVSELIVMTMQGLLNNGDEILVPAPDYPLWTAAVNLAGGRAVHYLCDEQENWQPDIKDMETKITSRTKGIIVINPNNPTGAVYEKDKLQQIVKLAEEHGLIIFSDEIYDKILYDDYKHIPIATLSDNVFFITFSGLSKNYRAAGFRAGWMVLSGAREYARDYIDGLNMLSNMRLCSNVPAQYAIQTSLGGYQSVYDLTKEGGRLRKQRDFAWKKINDIPGLSCDKPQGALYLFPKLDVKRFNIVDDQQFVLDFLLDKHVQFVQGTGFNWPKPDHFRLVFLPNIEILDEAIGKLADFLVDYKQS